MASDQRYIYRLQKSEKVVDEIFEQVKNIATSIRSSPKETSRKLSIIY
jgi:hypothetical protein